MPKFLSVVSSDGIPIFSRTVGGDDIETPSVSTLGVLCAMYMTSLTSGCALNHLSITWANVMDSNPRQFTDTTTTTIPCVPYNGDDIVHIQIKRYFDCMILMMGSTGGDTDSDKNVMLCTLDVVASYLLMMCGVEELKQRCASPNSYKGTWKYMFDIIDTVLSVDTTIITSTELLCRSPRHIVLPKESDDAIMTTLNSFSKLYVVLCRYVDG